MPENDHQERDAKDTLALLVGGLIMVVFCSILFAVAVEVIQWIQGWVD